MTDIKTFKYFFLNWYSGGRVQVGPLSTAVTNRPIVPATDDYDDKVIGGMMIGRGNWSTRGKPAPLPFCPPQTPHAARVRTRAAAVGSQQRTAWATARRLTGVYITILFFLLKPPIQWVPGVKRLGREIDHSPPASAKVKNTWIYTSTSLYFFTA
jgi:hypothetical protein